MCCHSHRSRLATAITIVAAMLVLIALAGCNLAPTTSDRDLTLIDQSRLESILDQKESGAVLIDVRSPDDFARGHIPGAINIPLPDLHRHDPRLSRATSLIVYGDGPGDILAPAAAKKLIVLGYSGVYDYRGGLELWEASGGEVMATPADTRAP